MKTDIKLIGNAHLDPIWLWRWQERVGIKIIHLWLNARCGHLL